MRGNPPLKKKNYSASTYFNFLCIHPSSSQASVFLHMQHICHPLKLCVWTAGPYACLFFFKLEKNKDVIMSNCIYSVSSSCTTSPNLQNVIYCLKFTNNVLLFPVIPELQLQLWRLHPKVKMRRWTSVRRASLTCRLNTCRSKNWSNTWR